MSIIEELYHGTIQRPDARVYCNDSVFMAAVRRRQEAKDKLAAQFTEEQRALFAQIEEAESDLDCITRFNTYSDALSFGVQLVAECFISGVDITVCDDK